VVLPPRRDRRGGKEPKECTAMKAVFVGGGAHRLVGILRGAMGTPGVLDGGEICLYDLKRDRSQAMARMLAKTPEHARCGCRLTWDVTLEQALAGADVVSVILMAGSPLSFALGHGVSLRHGFISSDNVSPSGAFLALKGGPILLNVARKMEQYCPDALLLDFANPVAVLSGMINNHTRIRALGVCAGFTNHQWDLARIFGKDEQGTEFDVEPAGVNHISFIMRGTRHGRDLFQELDRHLATEWQPPPMNAWWSEVTRTSIINGLRKVIEYYRTLGVVIFSTEGDGMAHLHYDETLAESRKHYREESRQQIEESVAAGARARAEADQRFCSYLDQDLDARFWAEHWKEDYAFRRDDLDVFVQILKGVAGVAGVKIAASLPNRGVIAGIKDRHVVEYAVRIQGNRVEPAGHYTIPDSVHGLMAALAAHQTMLGDAMAAEDPKLLAQALLAYPVKAYSKDTRSLCKALLEINATEIQPALVAAGQYL
jgi:alpha-galactosidase/6-phospho-beta-glucosidase family protein